jgi:multidrug efflux pump subunit AcrA (membrane-fusion protein)
MPNNMKRSFQQPQFLFPVAVVAVLASALCFTGCGAKRETSKGNSSNLPTALVRIQTVQSKPQAINEEVVGTVRAKLHATLEATLSGRIDRLPVGLGQRVKAGELVARLDAAEINARLDQAEASLETCHGVVRAAGCHAGRI